MTKLDNDVEHAVKSANGKQARRRFWGKSFAALASLQVAGLNAQMPGGRPPGGAGGGAPPGGRPPDAVRCPPLEAAPASLSKEAINRHYVRLKSNLKLDGVAALLFDKFVFVTAAYLLDLESKKMAPRAVSASGASRLTQQLDEARNRYTALEEIDEHAKRLVANLDERQRLQFSLEMLPMPSLSTS